MTPPTDYIPCRRDDFAGIGRALLRWHRNGASAVLSGGKKRDRIAVERALARFSANERARLERGDQPLKGIS